MINRIPRYCCPNRHRSASVFTVLTRHTGLQAYLVVRLIWGTTFVTNCVIAVIRRPGFIRCGRDFSALVQTGPGTRSASYTVSTGSFPGGGGVKRPGRGVDHPPTSSAEVKETVKLYLCSPLWAFAACSTVDFTFTRFYDHLFFFSRFSDVLGNQRISNCSCTVDGGFVRLWSDCLCGNRVLMCVIAVCFVQ